MVTEFARIVIDEVGGGKVVARLEQVGNAATTSATKVSALSKAVNVAAVGFTAATVALAGLAAGTSRALNTLDSLAEASERVGVGIEPLQEFRAVFQEFGVSAEQTTGALQFFQRAIARASTGNQEAIDTFQRLGISLDDLKNLGTEDLLARLADGFARTDSTALKLQASTQLLGRGSAELVNALSQGSEALGVARERARALGQVIDENTVKAAAELADEWERQKSVLDTQFTKTLASLGPIFIEIAEAVAVAARFWGEFFEQFRDVGSQSTEGLQKQLGALRAELTRLEDTPFGQVSGSINEVREKIELIKAELAERERLGRAEAKQAEDKARASAAELEAAAQLETSRENAKKAIEEQAAALDKLRGLTDAVIQSELAETDPLAAKLRALQEQQKEMEALAALAGADGLLGLTEARLALERQIAGVLKEQEDARSLELAPFDIGQLEPELDDATRASAQAAVDEVGKAFDDLAKDQERFRALGEDIGQILGGGMHDVLQSILEGEAVDFGEILSSISADLLHNALSSVIDSLSTQLGDLLSGAAGSLSGAGGSGTGTAGFGAALGAGLALVAGALQDNNAKVRNNLARSSAVQDVRATRGVVAGPTSIPIFQVGESLEQALIPTNDLLAQILASLRARSGAAGSSLDAEVGPLLGATSPSLA